MSPLLLLTLSAIASNPPTVLDEGNYLDISVQGDGATPSPLETWSEAVRAAPVPSGVGLANARGELQQGHSFPLPPALLQPTLSLGYSTNSGHHSRTGRGWTLSAGVVAMIPPRGSDRAYVGDGIRRVLTVQGDGLDGFLVEDSAGVRWESTSPSSMHATFFANGDIRLRSGVRRWLLTETTKGVWRTVQTRDSVGNLIDYTWTGSQLDRIDYGGTNSGVAHNVHVLLDYALAAHASRSATFGELEVIDNRLDTITVRTGSTQDGFQQLSYGLHYSDGSDPAFAEDELLLGISETDLKTGGITRVRAEYAYHGLDLTSHHYEAVAAGDGFDFGASDVSRQGGGSMNRTMTTLMDLSFDGLPDVVGPAFQVNPMMRSTDDFVPSMWSQGVHTSAAFSHTLPDADYGQTVGFGMVRQHLNAVGNPYPYASSFETGENGSYLAMRTLDVDGDGLVDRVRAVASEHFAEPLFQDVTGDGQHDMYLAQLQPDLPIHESGVDPTFGTWLGPIYPGGAASQPAFRWEVCWGNLDPSIGFTVCDVVDTPFAAPQVGSRVVLPQWGAVEFHGIDSVDQYDMTVDLIDMDADGWLDIVYMAPNGQIFYYPHEDGSDLDEPVLSKRSAGWPVTQAGRKTAKALWPNPGGMVGREGHLDRADYNADGQVTSRLASIDIQETFTSVEDVNGDGLMDLINTDSAPGNWTVFFGNGDGFDEGGVLWPAPESYVGKSFEGQPWVTWSVSSGLPASFVALEPIEAGGWAGTDGTSSTPPTPMCSDIDFCDLNYSVPVYSYLPIEDQDCDGLPTQSTQELCGTDRSQIHWEPDVDMHFDNQSPQTPGHGSYTLSAGTAAGFPAYVASGLLDMDADGRPDFFDGWNHTWYRNLGDGFETVGRPIPSWWPTVENDYGDVHEVLSGSYTEQIASGGATASVYNQQAVGSPSTTRTFALARDLNGDRLPDVLFDDGTFLYQGTDLSDPDGFYFSGGLEPQQPPGSLASVTHNTGLENHFTYMSSTEVFEAGHATQLATQAAPHAVENQIVRSLLRESLLVDPYTGGEWARSYDYAYAYCDLGVCWGFDTITAEDLLNQREATSNAFAQSLVSYTVQTYGAWDLSGGRLVSSSVQRTPQPQSVVYRQDYTYGDPSAPGATRTLDVPWPVSLTATETRPDGLRQVDVVHEFDDHGNRTKMRHDASDDSSGFMAVDPQQTVVQTIDYVGSADGVLWVPERQVTLGDDGTGTLVASEHAEFAYDDGAYGAPPTDGLLTAQRLASSGLDTTPADWFEWTFDRAARGQVHVRTLPNGLTIERLWGAEFESTWTDETVSGDFGTWVSTQSVDSMGRVNRITLPNGNVEETDYDGFGRVVERRDQGRGSSTELAREQLQYVEATANEPARVMTTLPRYDDHGVQYGSHTTYTVFDGAGRDAVIWEEDEDTGYRVTGARRGLLDQDVSTWTNWRSAFSPTYGVGVLPPLIEPIAYSRFDSLGEATETWTAEGGLTHLERPVPGVLVAWSFDVQGGASEECSQGESKRTVHDARGRLVEVFEGDASDTWAQHTRTGSYAYDTNGRVVSFTDGGSEVYSYAYDGVGRLKEVQVAGAAWASYGYDEALPHPTSMTDADGGITGWTYDQLGRTLKQEVGGRGAFDDETNWSWDSGWKGALDQVTFATAHGVGTLDYTYTDLPTVGGHGWLTEESQYLPGAVPADDRTYSFIHTHDGQGWVTATEWPDQPTGLLELQSDYFLNGRAASKKVKTSAGELHYDLGYDVFGELSDWTLDHPTSTASGSTLRIAAGKVASLDWAVQGSVHTVDYAYCGQDERLLERSYDNGTPHALRYDYDRLGRLHTTHSRSATVGPVLVEEYTYDAANRMLTLAVPAAGISARTNAYVGGDLAAVATLGGVNLRTMGTDMSHRLVQDVVAGGPTFDFVYDATSRVVQTTRTSAGGAIASTSLWYGPGNALVQEVRSNGSEIHRFQGYQERNGTTYAAVLPWLTLEDGLPRYTLTEPDGRAAVVLKPNGSLEAERFVSAYGVELTGLGAYPTYSPSGAWPLGGLHGSEPDTTMGVTHFGARHMSLRGDGMWLQREPLLMAGPTLGDLTHPLRYGAVYAGGNTNLVADPSGMFPAAAAPLAGGSGAGLGGPLGVAVAMAWAAQTDVLQQNVIPSLRGHMEANHPGANLGSVVSALQKVATGNVDASESGRSDDALIEAVTGGAPPVQAGGKGKAEVHEVPGKVGLAEELFGQLAGGAEIVELGGGKKLARRLGSNVVYRPPAIVADGAKPATVEIQTPKKGAEGNRKIKFPDTLPADGAKP